MKHSFTQMENYTIKSGKNLYKMKPRLFLHRDVTLSNLMTLDDADPIDRARVRIKKNIRASIPKIVANRSVGKRGKKTRDGQANSDQVDGADPKDQQHSPEGHLNRKGSNKYFNIGKTHNMSNKVRSLIELTKKRAA